MKQQVIQSRVKKEYSPPYDPGWKKQWSLVSGIIILFLRKFWQDISQLSIIAQLIIQLIMNTLYPLHQRNTGQNGPPGLDLNVEPAWMQGVTGDGVIVGLVDDG